MIELLYFLSIETVGFLPHFVEVPVVREQQFIVDSFLINKQLLDNLAEVISVGLTDCSLDRVTNEVISVFTFKMVKPGHHVTVVNDEGNTELSEVVDDF